MNFPFLLPSPTSDDSWQDSQDYRDTGGYIAVDANPYCIRLAHTISGGGLMDALEAKPHQIQRVINFVRSRKRTFPDVELTGARHDRWPPGLLPALTLELGPVCWAPKALLKQTVPDFRRSTQLLKFFRATLLAECAREASNCFDPCIEPVLERWRKAMFTELAYSLDIGPCPEVPF